MKISIGLVAAVAIASFSALAEAKTYTTTVIPSHRSCYDIDYVPATVLINTRGALVRGASVSRNFAIIENIGGVAVDTLNPAIYLEKRRLVEPDHYTMRSASCR